MNFPTAHVMAARDDPGLDSFGHPRAHYKISNFCFDTDQVAGTQAKFGRMTGMQPKRVCVGDFIQPFRIGTAGVNLNRQTESRDQDRLIRFETFRMNVTDDIRGNRALAPAPAGQRSREEFQLAGRCIGI